MTARLRAASHDERRAMLLGALRASRGVVLIRGGSPTFLRARRVLARGRGRRRAQPRRGDALPPPGPSRDPAHGNAIDRPRASASPCSRARRPSRATPATGAETIAYDPVAHSPVWHTDQAFREPPRSPPQSLPRAPPPGDGGDTPFAAPPHDAPSDEDKARIDDLDAICSYAHHNAKVKKRTPSYPLLTPEERAKNPPCSSPWREPCEYYVRSSESRAPSGADEKMSVRLKDDGACTA